MIHVIPMKWIILENYYRFFYSLPHVHKEVNSESYREFKQQHNKFAPRDGKRLTRR